MDIQPEVKHYLPPLLWWSKIFVPDGSSVFHHPRSDFFFPLGPRSSSVRTDQCCPLTDVLVLSSQPPRPPPRRVSCRPHTSHFVPSEQNGGAKGTASQVIVRKRRVLPFLQTSEVFSHCRRHGPNFHWRWPRESASWQQTCWLALWNRFN